MLNMKSLINKVQERDGRLNEEYLIQAKNRDALQNISEFLKDLPELVNFCRDNRVESYAVHDIGDKKCKLEISGDGFKLQQYYPITFAEAKGMLQNKELENVFSEEDLKMSDEKINEYVRAMNNGVTLIHADSEHTVGYFGFSADITMDAITENGRLDSMSEWLYDNLNTINDLIMEDLQLSLDVQIEMNEHTRNVINNSLLQEIEPEIG